MSPFSFVEFFHFLMVCHSICYYTFKNKFSKSYAKTLIFSITPRIGAGLLTWPQQPHVPNQNHVITASVTSGQCIRPFNIKKKAYNNTLDIFTYLKFLQVWFILILPDL